MKFNRLQSQSAKSLVDRLAEDLSQMIIDKDLKAGDKLPNELDLSAALDVGRGTLREAIKILVSRNILEIQRGRGTFVVSKPGVVSDPWGFKFIEDKLQLAIDLLETRILIEPGIARLAAERATDDERTQLQDLCDAVETLILNHQPHLTTDIGFHRFIAQCSKNNILTELIPIITTSIDVSIEMTNNALLDETIATHRAITDAIVHHDPEAAQKAMLAHLLMNQERLLERKKAQTQD